VSFEKISQPFQQRMDDVGLPREAVRSFLHHLRYLIEGGSGFLRESEIRPVPRLQDAGELEGNEPAGEEALGRTVIIKLNGGLGTSMGLEGPKSLIPVRRNLSFLDLIVRQVLNLRRKTGLEIPLVLMNSFRTQQASLEVLQRYPDLRTKDLPADFLQHRVPKVVLEDFRPARYSADRELEWCPPGHGDIYTALATSGTLDDLLEAGIEYAFISNADNLGAVIDPEILGWMVNRDLDFVMEAADRTSSDRKGGHLCLDRNDRLVLRESAQCHDSEKDYFQDITRHRYFNTNTLWVRLSALARLLRAHDGVLPLETIINRKTLDPRNDASVPVAHLETAMGSAISLFEKAAALRVPRSRFSPVKTTSDLLAVRSDAYALTEDFRIVQAVEGAHPPQISLDPRFYRMLSDFEERFSAGIPSLRSCKSLEISGDLFFGKGVLIEGRTRISVRRSPARVADGVRLSGDVFL